MKKLLLSAATLSLAAGTGYAGGLDRSGQGVNILFEEGTVVQFGYSYVDPKLTGKSAVDGSATGDVGRGYSVPHLSYKQSLNETLDVAIIYDQPFGAHVSYDQDYFLSVAGSPDQLQAEADAHALTAIVRKKLDGGFSIYGGVRAQTVEATISVPRAAGYEMESNSPTDFGYLIGAAWERPDIAARVALTYNSSIKQTLKLSESSLFGPGSHSANIETPQSLNLDFQTGVAPNTLVFGTVRWVNWSDFELSSPNYLGGSPVGTLVGYDDDAITYTLGVGHRFNEKFSGAIQLGYERSVGGTVSDLGPSDGYLSLGVGGTYTQGNVQYSAGIRYIDIGDATTDNGGVFEDNDGWAAGFQITYHFDK